MRPFDDRLDLRMEREMDVSPDLVWRAWTEPDHLKRWFAPRPVETTHAEIEPEPGGAFRTVMRLPDGSEIDSNGCILVAEPGRRLAFTDGLIAGWRPAEGGFMTAVIDLEPSGEGTRYKVWILHRTEEDKARHEAMGFTDGWSTAIAQLEEVARELGGEAG